MTGSGELAPFDRNPVATTPIQRRTFMKLRITSRVILSTLLLGAITSLTGCATTGQDRAERITDSLQTVEEDYKKASEQIDVTRASLEELIKPHQTNMKKAYETFDDDSRKMEKSGAKLQLHSDKMRLRGNEYFVKWEDSYTNPDIRQLSERRRIEMREGFGKIADASIGVKGSLKSYLLDIGEIHKFLANDLTPQAVESIRPVAQRAVVDGDILKQTVVPVLNAIAQVRIDMAQGGANP